MNTLTNQEKRFVKGIVETGNQTQSVKDAFGIRNDQYARVKGHILVTKANIKEAIQSIAERIPDELLEKTHLEGLEASDKIYNNEGEVLLEKPDYAVRHKYLDSAYKLKGSYAPEKSVNVNIEKQMMGDEELQAIALKLNELHKRTDISGT